MPVQDSGDIINKGSRGREEKLIYFTAVIEEQLHKYIRTERSRYDPHRRKRLEELDDHDPLFLTIRGTAYTRSSFYHHWKKLFEPAQAQFKKQERVEFSPHDIRHLRVSKAIAQMRQKANGDKGAEAELAEGFRLLMGWRNARTMEVYAHTLNKRKALLDIMLEEEEEQPPLAERSIERQEPALEEGPFQGENARETETLSEQEEDFSWYEV